MNIAIFGFSSFVGSHIVNTLSREHNVIKVNARNISYNSSDQEIFDYFEKAMNCPDLVINFCANSNPKSKNDFFINENLSKTIQKYVSFKKINTHLFHVSTINVLINKRLEKYTISKKNAEKNLENSHTSIIRLPMIVNYHEGKKGDLEIFYKYVNFKFTPFYPMIYPGNIYRPIEINNLCSFFLEVIKSNDKKQIYNLMGKKEMSLWDIFYKIANHHNKKTFQIDTSFLRKVLPEKVQEKIFENSSFFGQFLSVNQSDINTKNIIYL